MWGFQQKIPKKPVARPLVSVSAGPQKLSLASVVVCFFFANDACRCMDTIKPVEIVLSVPI